MVSMPSLPWSCRWEGWLFPAWGWWECLVECCRDSDRRMMTTRCEAGPASSSGGAVSLASSWRSLRSVDRVTRRQLCKENEIHECDVHNMGGRRNKVGKKKGKKKEGRMKDASMKEDGRNKERRNNERGNTEKVKRKEVRMREGRARKEWRDNEDEIHSLEGMIETWWMA